MLVLHLSCLLSYCHSLILVVAGTQGRVSYWDISEEWYSPGCQGKYVWFLRVCDVCVFVCVCVSVCVCVCVCQLCILNR